MMPHHRYRDDPSASEQLVQVWKGFPELSRRLVMAIVAGTVVVHLFPGLRSTLVLCPRNTFSLHLWNLVTYVLAEPSLISALLNAAMVAVMGRYVEPIWGASEMLKFIGIVTVFAGVGTFATATLICMVASSSWLTDYYCGFLPVIAGLTVALKQLMPDFEVQFFFARLRLKHLPFAFVAFQVTLELLLGAGPRPVSTMMDLNGQEVLQKLPMRGGSSLLVLFGAYGAWLYLRYFQSYLNTAESSGMAASDRGDPSESFAFHSFFPEMLQPVARRVSSAVHRSCHPLVVRLLSTSRPAPSSPPGRTVGGPAATSPVPAADPEEVRRKAAAAAIQRAAAAAPAAGGEEGV
eukprot:EG_transcript_15929